MKKFLCLVLLVTIFNVCATPKSFAKKSSAAKPTKPAIASVAKPTAPPAPAPTPKGNDITGLIYDIGKTSAEPRFIQETKRETLPGGEIRASSVITDEKHETVLTETAMYRGDRLVSQQVDQIQTGDQYEISIKDKEITFSRSPLASSKDKEVRKSTEKLVDNFITGPTIVPFLREHWDELMAGKSVNSRFGVLERRETVGFKFFLNKKVTLDGKELMLITMKPTSFIIAGLVDPLDLYIDPVEKRYEHFKGRTPLMHSVKGKLVPYDGEINFSYH